MTRAPRSQEVSTTCGEVASASTGRNHGTKLFSVGSARQSDTTPLDDPFACSQGRTGWCRAPHASPSLQPNDKEHMEMENAGTHPIPQLNEGLPLSVRETTIAQHASVQHTGALQLRDPLHCIAFVQQAGLPPTWLCLLSCPRSHSFVLVHTSLGVVPDAKRRQDSFLWIETLHMRWMLQNSSSSLVWKSRRLGRSRSNLQRAVLCCS